MRALWAVFLRELRSYFFSPLAYVVLTLFLVYNGVVFAVIIGFLNNPAATTARPFDLFFGGFLFWVVLLIVAPILAMRLISEELRSGSIEVLMTAPVTEAQVVVAKYFAALTFYMALWAPTVTYALIIAHYSSVDWGPIAGGYFGIFCIGALFLAVGLFASATTKNQLIAAIFGFVLIMLLFSFALLENLWNDPTAKKVFGYLNVLEHLDEFAKGIVDTRRLVYYVTAIFFFLFLSTRALEDKKWR